MNNPLVSVIIPVYNVENYIARCLDSVISQTYNNLEIIIVNDATPDNSMTIAYEYAKNDKRFKIIDKQNNMGLMITRWEGYQTASGEYIIFVDSDDYLSLNAVEILLAKALQNHADLIVGNILKYEKNGNTAEIKNSLPFGSDTMGYYQALLEGRLTHSLCGKLFQKSLLQEHRYQILAEMTNGEDASLLYQVIRNARKVSLINTIVYYYRYNPQSSTNSTPTLRKIDNILAANLVRYKSCVHYPTLAKSLEHHITFSVMKLYGLGISSREIRISIENAGLRKYGTMTHAWKILSWHELLCLAKLYLNGVIHKTTLSNTL